MRRTHFSFCNRRKLIFRMRDYTSQLASRLEGLSQDQLALKNDGQQAAAAARNAEYRDRYMRMRGEYRQLLRSRTDSIKKSGKLSQVPKPPTSGFCRRCRPA